MSNGRGISDHNAQPGAPDANSLHARGGHPMGGRSQLFPGAFCSSPVNGPDSLPNYWASDHRKTSTTHTGNRDGNATTSANANVPGFFSTVFQSPTADGSGGRGPGHVLGSPTASNSSRNIPGGRGGGAPVMYAPLSLPPSSSPQQQQQSYQAEPGSFMPGTGPLNTFTSSPPATALHSSSGGGSRVGMNGGVGGAMGIAGDDYIMIKPQVLQMLLQQSGQLHQHQQQEQQLHSGGVWRVDSAGSGGAAGSSAMPPFFIGAGDAPPLHPSALLPPPFLPDTVNSNNSGGHAAAMNLSAPLGSNASAPAAPINYNTLPHHRRHTGSGHGGHDRGAGGGRDGDTPSPSLSTTNTLPPFVVPLGNGTYCILPNGASGTAANATAQVSPLPSSVSGGLWRDASLSQPAMATGGGGGGGHGVRGSTHRNPLSSSAQPHAPRKQTKRGRGAKSGVDVVTTTPTPSSSMSPAVEMVCAGGARGSSASTPILPPVGSGRAAHPSANAASPMPASNTAVGTANGSSYKVNQWYEGFVKRYNPMRGFGFLTGTHTLVFDAKQCEDDFASYRALMLGGGGMAGGERGEEETPAVATASVAATVPSHGGGPIAVSRKPVTAAGEEDRGSAAALPDEPPGRSLSPREHNLSSATQPPDGGEADVAAAVAATPPATGPVSGAVEAAQHGTVVPSTMQWYLRKLSNTSSSCKESAGVDRIFRRNKLIRVDDSATLGDIFVHHSCISMDEFRVLPVNAAVRFSVSVIMNTVQAVDVVPLDESYWPPSKLREGAHAQDGSAVEPMPSFTVSPTAQLVLAHHAREQQRRAELDTVESKPSASAAAAAGIDSPPLPSSAVFETGSSTGGAPWIKTFWDDMAVVPSPAVPNAVTAKSELQAIKAIEERSSPAPSEEKAVTQTTTALAVTKVADTTVNSNAMRSVAAAATTTVAAAQGVGCKEAGSSGSPQDASPSTAGGMTSSKNNDTTTNGTGTGSGSENRTDKKTTAGENTNTTTTNTADENRSSENVLGIDSSESRHVKDTTDGTGTGTGDNTTSGNEGHSSSDPERVQRQQLTAVGKSSRTRACHAASGAAPVAGAAVGGSGGTPLDRSTSAGAGANAGLTATASGSNTAAAAGGNANTGTTAAHAAAAAAGPHHHTHRGRQDPLTDPRNQSRAAEAAAQSESADTSASHEGEGNTTTTATATDAKKHHPHTAGTTAAAAATPKGGKPSAAAAKATRAAKDLEGGDDGGDGMNASSSEASMPSPNSHLDAFSVPSEDWSMIFDKKVEDERQKDIFLHKGDYLKNFFPSQQLQQQQQLERANAKRAAAAAAAAAAAEAAVAAAAAGAVPIAANATPRPTVPVDILPLSAVGELDSSSSRGVESQRNAIVDDTATSGSDLHRQHHHHHHHHHRQRNKTSRHHLAEDNDVDGEGRWGKEHASSSVQDVDAAAAAAEERHRLSVNRRKADKCGSTSRARSPAEHGGPVTPTAISPTVAAKVEKTHEPADGGKDAEGPEEEEEEQPAVVTPDRDNVESDHLASSGEEGAPGKPPSKDTGSGSGNQPTSSSGPMPQTTTADDSNENETTPTATTEEERTSGSSSDDKTARRVSLLSSRQAREAEAAKAKAEKVVATANINSSAVAAGTAASDHSALPPSRLQIESRRPPRHRGHSASEGPEALDSYFQDCDIPQGPMPVESSHIPTSPSEGGVRAISAEAAAASVGMFSSSNRGSGGVGGGESSSAFSGNDSAAGASLLSSLMMVPVALLPPPLSSQVPPSVTVIALPRSVVLGLKIDEEKINPYLTAATPMGIYCNNLKSASSHQTGSRRGAQSTSTTHSNMNNTPSTDVAVGAGNPAGMMSGSHSHGQPMLPQQLPQTQHMNTSASNAFRQLSTGGGENVSAKRAKISGPDNGTLPSRGKCGYNSTSSSSASPGSGLFHDHQRHQLAQQQQQHRLEQQQYQAGMAAASGGGNNPNGGGLYWSDDGSENAGMYKAVFLFNPEQEALWPRSTSAAAAGGSGNVNGDSGGGINANLHAFGYFSTDTDSYSNGSATGVDGGAGAGDAGGGRAAAAVNHPPTLPMGGRGDGTPSGSPASSRPVQMRCSSRGSSGPMPPLAGSMDSTSSSSLGGYRNFTFPVPPRVPMSSVAMPLPPWLIRQ